MERKDMNRQAPLEIRDLDCLTPEMTTIFGGKACGLARLIFMGARVPAGFAVSATTIPIEQWPRETRNKLIDKVRELFDKGPVVVRSSALGEDSAEKSFAGMFETVLGIITETEALFAANRCIESGNSERVKKYAGSQSSLPVGLVVQSQVAAKAAGVCFTCDPTGKDHAVVIEAVRDMGDKLVSGKIEPERFQVYRSGTGEWEIPAGKEVNFISLEEITFIAGKAKELEEKFGQHLDIEWAVDENRDIWWLQARPVTVAATPVSYSIQRSLAEDYDGPVTVWSNWNVRETMPEPLFPFTWSFWRDRLLPVVARHLTGVSKRSRILPYLAPLDLIHGRIYFNMNAMLAAPLIGPLTTRIVSTMDTRAGDTLKHLKKNAILRPRKYPGASLNLFFSLLKASFISFLRILRWLNPGKSIKMLEEDSRAITQGKDITTMTDQELVDEFDLWERPECCRLLYGLQIELLAMVYYLAAKRAFKQYPEVLELLSTGIPASPTTQISIEIDTLIEAAEPFRDLFTGPLTMRQLFHRLKKEEGGDDWLMRFHHFLNNFGHRGPMEFDLGSSRWSDDPTMIIETIRSGLRLHKRERLITRMNRLAEKRESVLKHAISASPPWKRPMMRWLAHKVELYMPLREAPKHYAVIVFQHIRHVALELGKRLKRRGSIPAKEDVFFLEIEELVNLVQGMEPDSDLRTTLNGRKHLYKRFKHETPPGIFRSDGVPVLREIAPSNQAREGTLQGTAVSGGRTAGPVCILSEPDPTAMKEGDIIVMEYADPGWTPLFPRASGIVMEVGGLMCHAAVVARELGIPAVFGIPHATAILKSGQYVKVDGTKGIVVFQEQDSTSKRME
jgi:phosphohistidine swiveling domain-containing protein